MAFHFITTVLGVLCLGTTLYAQQSGGNSERTQTGTATGTKPDICRNATFDTVTRTEDGITYAFQGDWYWKVGRNFSQEGYPKSISADWIGLPGNLDASFTDSDNHTYFFKGKLYWRFRNKKKEAGFPKLISEGFEGIPNYLDAVLPWRNDDIFYFFKGSDYWLYNPDTTPHVSNWYPKAIDDWEGLPEDGIDAAYQSKTNASYFMKGTRFYRFPKNSFQVSRSRKYPKSTARVWFKCPVA